MDNASKIYQSRSGTSFIKCVINFKRSKRYFITFNMLNLLLSISCIIIYIYETYFPNQILIHNNIFFMYSFVCRIYFLVDFILDIIMMSIEKTFDIFEIIEEILSFFPFLIMRFVVGMKFDLINNADVICTSLVVTRIFRIGKFSHFFKSDVNRELYNIVCSIISLLLTSTVLINVFENTQTVGKYWLFLERDCTDSSNCNGSNDTFHTTLFLVMTTLSTIGYYSSITSTIGRCLIIVLIIIQVVAIPSMCGDLMTQLTSKSIYARTSYNQIDKVDFILISGNISMGSIDILLQEYFHPDHGENEKHALVLMPTQPEPFMKKLMQKYQNKLFYFEGDCLKFNDLERCMFDKAKTIMLLCNKQSDDSSMEDSKTIIQAMAIKKYLAQLKENRKKNEKQKRLANKDLLINKISYNTNPQIEPDEDNRLVIQLMRPESEHHFELSISKNSNKDQILCIDELKLSLLAKTCLCKGIITLLTNLITTNNLVGDSKDVEEIMNANPWLDEYTEGKDYEIYKISLDSNRGSVFSDVAHRIYKMSSIILFGLNIENIKTKNSLVLLAPCDFVLPEDNNITIYGYILAKDQTAADKVNMAMQNLKKKTMKNEQAVPPEIFGQLSQKRGDDDEGDSDRKDKYINEKLILGQAFHVTSEQIPKENAICTSLQNKLFIKKGHIIICGICQNLLDFIKPLRAKHILKSECPTIVILSKELPDDKVWSSMAYFDELFIVQGDSMNKKDLMRAGIATASKVVILAPMMSEISSYSKKREDDSTARKLTREEEDLLDAKTIFRYNLISKIRKDIFCVIELVNPKNVSFLNNKNRLNNDEYLFINAGMDITLTSSFASGEVYYSNVMDNLMSQTYYNQNLLGVLDKLIIGEKENSLKKRDLRKYLKVPSGNLYLIDMPSLESLYIYDMSQLTFGYVFDKLLRQKKMICLGVYKEYSSERDNDGVENKMGMSMSSKASFHAPKNTGYDVKTNFYYVVTSPARSFKLSQRDKLFVISVAYPNTDQNGELVVEEGNDIMDGVEMFSNDKGFGIDKNKRKDFRESRKEVDYEGEKKLRMLNKTITDMKDMLKEVKDSVNLLNAESKKKITEGIKDTISTILKDNKLSNF